MITSNDVKEFVENNPDIVSKREIQIPELSGLSILKYKNRVFYDNLWHKSHLLLECRGTIVDENYDVVSRPFTKIFNYQENGTTIDDDSVCEYHEKVNGFMAAVSLYRGKMMVSTTGSVDSKFAELAKKNLAPYIETIQSWMVNHQSDNTFIFEIVDKTDPHIIKETPGVYLIGMRKNSWNSKSNLFVDDPALTRTYSNLFGIPTPNIGYAKFSDIKKMAKYSTKEGYVVYEIFGKGSLKIKSPFYLTSKFLARKRSDKLELLLSDPRKLRSSVDEEFYPLLDNIHDNMSKFLELDEQGRLEYINNYFYDRSIYGLV